MTNEELLALNVKSDDHDDPNLTIKGYLESLLITLWQKGEGFSGKRPFGNSGWEYALYEPLVKAGAVRGSFDTEYGYLDEVDIKAAESVVFGLIKTCFK